MSGPRYLQGLTEDLTIRGEKKDSPRKKRSTTALDAFCFYCIVKVPQLEYNVANNCFNPH